jgi:hypothetical protein
LLGGDIASKVGDVSPKHYVGNSRLEAVCGRKSNSIPLCNIDFRPNTGTSRLSPTQPWMKILRRKVAYLFLECVTFFDFCLPKRKKRTLPNDEQYEFSAEHKNKSARISLELVGGHTLV